MNNKIDKKYVKYSTLSLCWALKRPIFLPNILIYIIIFNVIYCKGIISFFKKNKFLIKIKNDNLEIQLIIFLNKILI